MNDVFFTMLLLGALSGGPGEPLPFWATANQWGLMPENQGTLAMVKAKTDFDASRTLQLSWGVSMVANGYVNGLDSGSNPIHLMTDELYGSLRWKALTLDLGIKHRELDFYGADSNLGSMSTTGGHVAESGNARAMPGYLISLEPQAIPWTNRHVWIYGAFGDYKPLGERYVKDPLVHRTRIGFRFDVGSRIRLGFLLDHYAIWAGTMPGKETMQVTFSNYCRVVTGMHAGGDGTRNDQINVIGDQGGGEMWGLEYLGHGWKIKFQHDIPYADGSGMGFQNFPDGVTTLHLCWDDKSRWVSDILYEHTYTMYQSGPFNRISYDADGNRITPPGAKTTGGDNYFNNIEYKSGWTHYGRPIGTPLMYPVGTHNGTWTSAGIVLGLENTRLKAHHFSLSGSLFHKSPYKFMLTYSYNHGTYWKPYAGKSAWNEAWGSVDETPLRQFCASFTGSIRLFERALERNNSRSFSILYGLYFDRGEVLKDSFGATVGLYFTL